MKPTRILAGLIAAGGLLLPLHASAAGAPTPTTIRSSDCRTSLEAGLRSHHVAPTEARQLRAYAAAGCPLTATSTLSLAPAAQLAATAAGPSWCGVYQATYWFGPGQFLPGEGGLGHFAVRADLCGNPWGSYNIAVQWGPDCGLQGLWGVFWGFNNGGCFAWYHCCKAAGGTYGWYVDIGANFWLAPYAAPWWHINYWVRNEIYRNGWQSGSWGG